MPDGKKFYVADMMADGVWMVDGTTMTVTGKIDTGVGAHGIYPSRDGTRMYVSNRAATWATRAALAPRRRLGVGRRSAHQHGRGDVGDPRRRLPRHGRRVRRRHPLWLSGRYDAEVYVFDTTRGALVGRIPVDPSPHGLAVWPQPGRFSLGHTGNTR